jgi:protein-S-isoprenylcysteine O-methyltransferase Ste14
MNFISWCWTIFLAIWVVTALRTKRTRSAESFREAFAYRLVTVIGALLVFDRQIRWGILSAPIIPWSRMLYDIGAGLTVLGILFACWARFHLGRNWSGNVTIKTDHELIRTGPYARIRHPIYTGILLAIIGSGLAIDQWCVVPGCVLVLAGFWLKARREEAVLSQEFGPKFAEHLRLTGMFLPRLAHGG